MRTEIYNEKVNDSYVLWPRDSRQSFYGKCHVYETDNYRYLESYDTLMCRVDRNTGKLEKLDDYKSQTTTRHLRSFFADEGINLTTRDFYKQDKFDVKADTRSDEEWFDDFKSKYDGLCDTTKKHLANSDVFITSKEQADAVMNMSLIFDMLFRMEEKD